MLLCADGGIHPDGDAGLTPFTQKSEKVVTVATERREPFRPVRHLVGTDSKFPRLGIFPAQKTGYRPETGLTLSHLGPETSIRLTK